MDNGEHMGGRSFTTYDAKSDHHSTCYAGCATRRLEDLGKLKNHAKPKKYTMVRLRYSEEAMLCLGEGPLGLPGERLDFSTLCKFVNFGGELADLGERDGALFAVLDGAKGT